MVDNPTKPVPHNPLREPHFHVTYPTHAPLITCYRYGTNLDTVELYNGYFFIAGFGVLTLIAFTLEARHFKYRDQTAEEVEIESIMRTPRNPNVDNSLLSTKVAPLPDTRTPPCALCQLRTACQLAPHI